MFLRSLRARAVVLMLLPALGSADAAPLSDAQAKCADTMTKHVGKTTAVVAKEIAGCVRAFAKGALPGGADACSLADVKGKVAARAAKTAADFAKRCSGPDAEGATDLPVFGAVSATATSGTGHDESQALARDLFGEVLDTALATGDAKATIGCQSSLLAAANKCVSTRLKAYRACAQSAVAAGVADATGLANACLGVGAADAPDPKGAIAKACGGGSEPGAIRSVVDRRCAPPAVDAAAAFPGCAPGSPTALANCVDAAAACRACRAVNVSAGLSRDCDRFDDGIANGTCAVCGNGVLEEDEQCDGTDGACPGQCLSLCACPGPRTFTTSAPESSVIITGLGAPIVFPLTNSLQMQVVGELAPGAVTIEVPVQPLAPVTANAFGAPQTLCVFFEQGTGLPPGVAGTGVVNCSGADIAGLIRLDSPYLQEFYDHCGGSSCDSAPNAGGGLRHTATGVFVPDGPVDPGCDDPGFRPDPNPAHAGNCTYGPLETAGPGSFRRGDATLEVRGVFDVRPGVSDCSGGPSPGAAEAVLEFTTGRAQTGIMDMNGQRFVVGARIAFGAPFDCRAFLRGGDASGAVLVGTFPVLDNNFGLLFRDILLDVRLVGN